jgi:hypothetical protein
VIQSVRESWAGGFLAPLPAVISVYHVTPVAEGMSGIIGLRRELIDSLPLLPQPVRNIGYFFNNHYKGLISNAPYLVGSSFALGINPYE